MRILLKNQKVMTMYATVDAKQNPGTSGFALGIKIIIRDVHVFQIRSHVHHIVTV